MSSGPIPKPADLQRLTPVEAMSVIRARDQSPRTPVLIKRMIKPAADARHLATGLRSVAAIHRDRRRDPLGP